MDMHNAFTQYVQYDKMVRDYISVYIKEHFVELKDCSDENGVCFERDCFLYFIELVDGMIVLSDENNNPRDEVRFRDLTDLFKYLHSKFV